MTIINRDPATCAVLSEFRTHHVALKLQVEMEKKRIVGTATLSCKRLSEAVSSMRLDVFHLVIHSVYVTLPKKNTVAAKWSIKPFTSFGETLEIEIPEELAQASVFELKICYETETESPGVCWLEKEQTAGKQLPFMYTQGQEVLNRSFFPCQDSPSVRVTYTASVIVPKELVCVMSAKMCSVEEYVHEEVDEGFTTIKKKFMFEMEQSIPVYLVAMAVGDLVEAKVGPRSSIWTEPCMIEAATKEFDHVLEEYLTIGEKLFGKYLWERYDMLVMPPSFPYGGMENPRLTFVSPCTIAGDKSLVSIVAHELSHSWFGNLVTNATWSDFFLNEGFTMYAERRITEISHGRVLSCLDAKLGEALLREEISSLGEQSPLTRLRVPLDEGIDPGDCYNMCAYEKGYAFVCYLRYLVGSDQVFDDFLRQYCAEFRFQSIPAESYPPFTPDLSDAQETMQNCELLAFCWSSSSIPVQPSVLYLTEAAKQWEARRIFYFLDCFLETKFSSAEVVIALGNTLMLWDSRNTEILFRWALVLIKNVVVSKLPVVRRFLEMQGKQKFQLPVYRLLTSSPNDKVRKFAVDTYEATKSLLHVMVRDRINLLLEAMIPVN
ncbi:unnamed protein product [Peronospora belbahrii]|uniref:Peptidase M1 leukotriene A4 hydrolase/aminopeptidase C-terminal domain-containing protein n=1 Tax=Peronospora belbahrii TaxID=622444 RepID=A0AAU9KXR8_9STRA|nr:unnamed protein product [Peronospora belbahrii]